LPGRRRSEVRERQDRDRPARAETIGRVRRLRDPGRGRQSQGLRIAGGQHRQRTLVASETPVVLRVTESEAQKECEKGDDRESGRELRAERGEARADPPVGRAEREIEDGGDLLVAQVGKKRQSERL